MSDTAQRRIAALQSAFYRPERRGLLEGRVCIVTGAASTRGIGRATVIAFAREGASAILALDYQNPELETLEAAVHAIAPNCSITTVDGDASDEAVVQGLCDRALKDHGRLDVFFANAGIAAGNVLEDIDVEDWDTMMRVNSRSCFLACRIAPAAMRETQPGSGKDVACGSIILTASVAGIRAHAGTVEYSASKAAVISLAQTTATALAGQEIRANALCPGLTPIFSGKTGESDGRVPKALQRHGVSEELASAALFLASDMSSFVNGQAIVVDGCALRPS